jgi:hypothetical protein
LEKCKKAYFATQEMAMLKIAEIKNTGKIRNGKIPHRAYHCKKCNGFHLTSMPLKIFKKIPIIRVNKIGMQFIRKHKLRYEDEFVKIKRKKIHWK